MRNRREVERREWREWEQSGEARRREKRRGECYRGERETKKERC